VELAFAERKLRDLCESYLKAERALGRPLATELKTVIADMRAVPSASDLVMRSVKEIPDAMPPSMSVQLLPGGNVLFCANHGSMPLDAAGKADWSSVTRVKILKIENTNAA
jgi:toxin HigB-1